MLFFSFAFATILALAGLVLILYFRSEFRGGATRRVETPESARRQRPPSPTHTRSAGQASRLGLGTGEAVTVGEVREAYKTFLSERGR